MSTHFIRTGDDLRELALLLILALDDGFDDGRVIRSEVDENIADSIFPECLKEGEGCRIAISQSVSETLL
jgi:hypothetical protein